jgi:hypothetical protein
MKSHPPLHKLSPTHTRIPIKTSNPMRPIRAQLEREREVLINGFKI